MVSGICNLPLVPLRTLPTEKSEMVTQILFGELFVLLEECDCWYKIRICSDSYIGWCTSKMLQLLPANFYNELYREIPIITSSVISFCKRKDLSDGTLCLPAGSRIYMNEINSGTFDIYHVNGENVIKECWQLSDKLAVQDYNPINLAIGFLNAPYLWGGKSVFGIDCSGLVQVVFSIIGIQLPRDARDQVTHGSIVPTISDILPGDLAFFADAEGNVIHVGISMGNNSIIHASGSVHFDRLDELGIYSNSLAVYTHKLYQIRRILPFNADCNQ